MSRVQSILLLAFFGLTSGQALAQGQNGITWAANFPNVIQPVVGQAQGKVEVKGGFTEKVGWTLKSVAIQYIPNPAPGGAQAQGIACDITRVAGNQWGKENRAFPGGPVIGVVPMEIALAPGKYQIWAIGAFAQNPPPGGWGAGGPPANAAQFIMTNVKDIEIKAPPKPKLEEPTGPPIGL